MPYLAKLVQMELWRLYPLKQNTLNVKCIWSVRFILISLSHDALFNKLTTQKRQYSDMLWTLTEHQCVTEVKTQVLEKFLCF